MVDVMDSGALERPSAVAIVIAVGIAVLESEMPGFMDRMIARLASDVSHGRVVRLHADKTEPSVLDSQDAALRWLSAMAPLVRSPVKRKRPRR